MTDHLPLWAVAASLGLNALFLRRLLSKIDRLSNCILGTIDPPRRGLLDRVRSLESVAGLADRESDWPGPERRRHDRRHGPGGHA